jgi:hypothetical protein
MAKRFLRHSATLLGAVSIMDLSGRTAYRELPRQLPHPSRRPAAARVADNMRSSLSDAQQRRAVSSR